MTNSRLAKSLDPRAQGRETPLRNITRFLEALYFSIPPFSYLIDYAIEK
jgi:hypothetical protein